MARPLSPRLTEAVAVAAVLVSDRTAPALVGLEPRAFRAFVLERGIAHTLAGRRMLVRAADLAAAIGTAPPDAAEVADVEPSRAAILRAVGAR